jgi:hypothetical protein
MNHLSFFNLKQKESNKTREQNNFSKINHKPIPMHKLPSISPFESSPKSESNLFSKNSFLQKKNSTIPSKQQSATVQQKFREYYERSPVPTVISKSLSPQNYSFQIPQKKYFGEAKDFLKKTSTLNQSITQPMSLEMNTFDKQYNAKVQENLKKIDSILMGKVLEEKEENLEKEKFFEQETKTETQEIESLLGFGELEQFDSSNEIEEQTQLEEFKPESPREEFKIKEIIPEKEIQKPIEKKSMEMEWRKYEDNPFDHGGFGDTYESEEEIEKPKPKPKNKSKPNLKRKRKVIQSSEEDEDFKSDTDFEDEKHFTPKKGPKPKENLRMSQRTSKEKAKVEKKKKISQELTESPPKKLKATEKESLPFQGNSRKLPRLQFPKKQISPFNSLTNPQQMIEHQNIQIGKKPEPSNSKPISTKYPLLTILPSKKNPTPIMDSSILYDIPSLNETLIDKNSDGPGELIKIRERYVDTKVKKIIITENSNDFLQLIDQKIPTSMNLEKETNVDFQPKILVNHFKETDTKPKTKKKSISKFVLDDESMDNDSMDEDFKPI